MLTSATATAQFTPTVDVGGRQVTLSWSSPFPGATELAWGPTSAPSFTGYPNRFTAPGTGNAHSATLRRLPPGTWFVRARTGSTESIEQPVVVPSDDGAPLADWAFDGTVNALLRHGSSWYVGGNFSSVGQTTGGGVPTLFDGGMPLHFPEVAGQVFAVESDGAGGFYIGGSFTSVGGLPRSNVAHLFPDLGVDPLWKPACNGSVYAIQTGVTGSVYLAGLFTRVSGQLRGPLAEILPNGAPTPWNPTVAGPVFALERIGGTVYIGGGFSAVNGVGRTGLAAIDGAGMLQGWNPALTGGSVYGLMELGGVIYVHGLFTGIAGQARVGGVAAVDLVGTVLEWNPPIAGGRISAFAPNGPGSLFIGGSFTSVGPLNRVALALVDTDGGQPLAWNAGLTGGQVVGLAKEAGGVSAVGSFTRNMTGLRVATFSAANGTPLSIGPRFNGIPRAVALSPSAVFVGGDFTGLSEQPRTGLAAISNTSGALEPFAPTLAGATFGNPTVNALAAEGATLVVGGNFTAVDGVSRNNAAMVTTSGTLNSGWDPNVGGTVWALAVGPGVVLIGGQFSQINGGTPRGAGAMVDVVNGQAVAFNPVFNNAVFGIAAEGATSYWVGGFGLTNGIARDHAAAFSLSSGTLDPWNASVTTDVKAVHVAGERIVLGGSFDFVNGTIVRRALAVFNRGDGGVTSFDAHLSAVAGVQALTSTGNTVYVGGSSLMDGGLVISVDLTSRAVQDIDVRGETDVFFRTRVGTVETLAADCVAQRVAVGGFFHSSGLTPVGGMTLIAAPCAVAVADAGTGNADAGTIDAGADAGSPDAGSPDAGADAGSPDAGSVDTDAGMGTVDAGVMPDAGSAMDAGVAPDAGPPSDGGATVDAGGPDGGGVDAGDGFDAGPDGGMGLSFVPACGCSGVDQAPLGLGLLLALLLRRRSTR